MVLTDGIFILANALFKKLLTSLWVWNNDPQFWYRILGVMLSRVLSVHRRIGKSCKEHTPNLNPSHIWKLKSSIKVSTILDENACNQAPAPLFFYGFQFKTKIIGIFKLNILQILHLSVILLMLYVLLSDLLVFRYISCSFNQGVHSQNVNGCTST